LATKLLTPKGSFSNGKDKPKVQKALYWLHFMINPVVITKNVQKTHIPLN